MRTRSARSLCVLAVLFAAGSLLTPNRGSAQEAGQDADCPICAIDLTGYRGPLSATEVQGLLRALNAEYRSRAAYERAIRDLGAVQPFVNVREAEEVHIAELAALFRLFDVPLPPDPWMDRVPPTPPLREACAAAAQSELALGALYEDLSQTTNRYVIQLVYQHLQRAALERHLVAFMRCARQPV